MSRPSTNVLDLQRSSTKVFRFIASLICALGRGADIIGRETTISSLIRCFTVLTVPSLSFYISVNFVIIFINGSLWSWYWSLNLISCFQSFRRKSMTSLFSSRCLPKILCSFSFYLQYGMDETFSFLVPSVAEQPYVFFVVIVTINDEMYTRRATYMCLRMCICFCDRFSTIITNDCPHMTSIMPCARVASLVLIIRGLSLL